MSALVTVQDVRHVAMLARLGLTDERAEALTHDLNTILEHMAVLAKVKTDAAPEASSVFAAAMPLSPDRGTSVPLAEPPESFAPAVREGFFLVPRLASHEDPEPTA
jgi:aspartyl-tRNA(Asn)/glutamyl-tRNA(Gln) amidotransferase subunit C